MEMPGLLQAIFAGVTLLILWSTTIVGAVSWISKRISEAKKEILLDFNAKHDANAQTVKALEVLVIRHDTMLNAEFGAPQRNGRSHLRG